MTRDYWMVGILVVAEIIAMLHERVSYRRTQKHLDGLPAKREESCWPRGTSVY